MVLAAAQDAVSVRSIALPAVVVESLEEHLRRWAGEGREGFVFTAPDGGHVDPDNFRSRSGVRRWLPPVSRPSHPRSANTTASLAIAAGADVKLLQTMLGHASAVMTLDRYGHLMPGRAQDIADRLDALARGAVAPPPTPVLPLDARDFRGMDATRAGSRLRGNRP
jgi:integrase